MSEEQPEEIDHRTLWLGLEKQVEQARQLMLAEGVAYGSLVPMVEDLIGKLHRTEGEAMDMAGRLASCHPYDTEGPDR